MSYNLYVIKSKKSLSSIKKIIGETSFVKIIYDKFNNETDSTLTFLTEEEFNRIEKLNVENFKIYPFSLKEKKVNSSSSLVIDIPYKYLKEENEVLKIIEEKMKDFETFNLIKKSDYTLHLPFSSRKNGVLSGKCFIFFKDEVDLKTVSLIRFLINKSDWCENEFLPIRCFSNKTKKN